MDIWVDADACPVVIKDLLYRIAQRTNTLVTLVANKSLQIPKSQFIKLLIVAPGFDVADNEIVKQMKAGDLVITADIPLAADVIDKGGLTLNPRGELYTKDNIGSRLYVRNLMDTLRSSGIETKGPAPMSQKDKQLFSNTIDKLLSSHAKTRNP
ncbi:MAG: YaiI/YqxD family protein [Desulfobacterales bacterium]|nr:YaiI/YqxD family protein [Desulfobacterales bacterium]